MIIRKSSDFYISDIMTSSTERKEKLNTENSMINRFAPFGSCRIYSLNVMRLASEAMSVPAPPMFTPLRSSA